MARLYDSTIHLLHVVEPEPAIEAFRAPFPNVKRKNEEALQKIHNLTRSFKAIGYREAVERGAVGDVMARLVVVGTHGWRGLKRLIFGSVAEQIFRRATCPVLTKKRFRPTRSIPTVVYRTQRSGTLVPTFARR
ncbi:MAG: universal stress protein [Terriglobales bacterium]